MPLSALVAALLALGSAGIARAQGQLPILGPVMGTQPGAIAGSGAPTQSSQSGDTPPSVNDSMVSIIDAAVPRNVFMLRFDGDMDNREPLRAGYLFGRFSQPASNVNMLQLTSSAEYAFTSWFSVFLEAPYRWVWPADNAYDSGAGDISYGFKLCTWSSDNFLATVLLRIYEPTAGNGGLGTDHWSIEPGLLAQYQFSSTVRLEGEFQYWQALGGNQYAGDLIRYGLGISYGQRRDGLWIAPVAEGVGWTVLSGETMVANKNSFSNESAQGQTIFNAYLGLRVGYGQNIDLYLGYGRSLTGDYWNRDTYRVELRFLY